MRACALFASLCQICVRKRAVPKKGVVVRPILSDGFNVRGQVDLVDFQSCPDGDFKFLMNYQDHGTKFLQLRPLTSKHARNVAEELFKIFQTFGAPQILHSDNGREFTAQVSKQNISRFVYRKFYLKLRRHEIFLFHYILWIK